MKPLRFAYGSEDEIECEDISFGASQSLSDEVKKQSLEFLLFGIGLHGSVDERLGSGRFDGESSTWLWS